MKLTIRERRGVSVIEIHGKLIGGPEHSVGFRELIKSLVAQGKQHIVVDLRHTSWANSQGIGLLIGALTNVTNAGGQLVLARVVDRIHDVLSVMRLLLIFKTFVNVDEAIEVLTEGAENGKTTDGPSECLWLNKTAPQGLGH